MQYPTSHYPVPGPDLSWPEQILIRLDEIVGLLDSIHCRLAHGEEGEVVGYNEEFDPAQVKGERDFLALLLRGVKEEEPRL